MVKKSKAKLSAVVGSSAANLRQLIASARWAFKIAWALHARFVTGLIFVTVVRSLVPAASALVIRELINTAVEAAENQPAELTLLIPWLLAGLLIAATEAICTLFYQFLNQRLGDELEVSITSKILNHAATLDLAFFEEPRFQDIIHRAQQNTASQFAQFLNRSLSSCTQFIQTLSLIAVLASIEPLAIVAMIPFTLPHLIFQWRLSRKHYWQVHQRATKHRWSSYFVSLLTSRQSVPEVKLLNLASVLIDRFRTLMREFIDQNRKKYVKSFAGDSVFAILSITAFYAVFARVFYRFLNGTLPIGDAVIFGTVGLRLRGSLQALVSSLSKTMEHALYISNLQTFLSTKPLINVSGDRIPVSKEGAIECTDVSFTYPGADSPVLSDISFTISPGETIALVGKNGAGKTTLVKLIARFYDPGSGSITCDGIDLRELSLEHLHRQIGFIPQRFGRYEGTVAENIAFGNYSRLTGDQEEIERVARYVGVDKLIEKMPQGYNTLLGRRFGEYDLSGGQWQQIATARAFARDAVIMILDEPTSNLDATAEYELFNRFQKLTRGKTTVLVSHRFSTVRMADRILVLDGGRIVENGTHDELVTLGGHYATLYEIQKQQMMISQDNGKPVFE